MLGATSWVLATYSSAIQLETFSPFFIFPK